MHPALLGPGLDIANKNMVNNLVKSVDELASTKGKTFDLYAWVKHSIAIASTDAVWGPKNPIRDPANEAAFWDFDSHLRLLVFKIFPSIIARKAYLGREKVVAAFVKYYNEGGQHLASELAHARWKVQHDDGASTEDIARMEAATVLGVVSNTTPSSFWMLYDIYSRPTLLTQLRDEVRQHALKQNDSGEMIIDLAAMRDHCPLLLATFQEILRTRYSPRLKISTQERSSTPHARHVPKLRTLNLGPRLQRLQPFPFRQRNTKTTTYEFHVFWCFTISLSWSPFRQWRDIGNGCHDDFTIRYHS
jgi:hypothetical protein